MAAFALGIGLTNDCNLNCAHCYRDTWQVHSLTRGDLDGVLEAIPVRSVNLGTGENGLHPEYRAILDALGSRDLRLSITSNGYSVQVLDDERVRRFHSIEFSVDFPTRAEQDAFRGAGNWDLVLRQAERCVALGVPVTLTAVMMRPNFDRLLGVARVAAGLGAHFRTNIYQPVKGDAFSLDFAQVWTGFRRLLGGARLVTTSESILRAALGLQGLPGCGCGRTTVRVTPDRRVIPCVYWPRPGVPLARLTPEITETHDFAAVRAVPRGCPACPLVPLCGGGCAGRRELTVGLDEPDPYCPFARGETPHLEAELAPGAEWPKIGSACTTIVDAS